MNTEIADLHEFSRNLSSASFMNTATELDSVIIDEMHELEKNQMNSNTMNQTQQHVKLFKTFLQEQRLPGSIEDMSARYLSQYLRVWYGKLTKKDKGIYSPSSLICMRASIQRYLTSSQVNRKVNIINGEDYKEANNMLKCKFGQYLKSNGSTINDCFD